MKFGSRNSGWTGQKTSTFVPSSSSFGKDMIRVTAEPPVYFVDRGRKRAALLGSTMLHICNCLSEF